MAAGVWFVLAIILLGVELITADLLFGSLALAALAAGLSGLATDSLIVQGIVFGVTSLLSLMFLRPAFVRRLHARSANSATNIDALIGADAIALAEVSSAAGEVKIGGEIWTARSRGQIIPAGVIVRVAAIEGAIAIVEEKN